MSLAVELGITAEDLALMSTKAYSNANKNPLAHMVGVEMAFEQAVTESKSNPCFLGNEEFKKYLKISDCSQVRSQQHTSFKHIFESSARAYTYMILVGV
jgi:hypothetical protein